MRKFFRSCKGAVTVFVTLLLIPAILVSGTSVDLARILAARSIVQDANQLAANSALASYDALLQDLYGLFGIMKDDPEFASMADRYIKLAIMGDSPTPPGNFQLFYGANLVPGEIRQTQALNETAVLRRQIEEYAKFRAPAILVDEVLERMKVFRQAKADNEVIQEKMEIEDKIDEIDEMYQKIYRSIETVSAYPYVPDSILPGLNNDFDKIHEYFKEMKEIRDQYSDLLNEKKDEEAKEYYEKYASIWIKIKELVQGTDRNTLAGESGAVSLVGGIRIDIETGEEGADIYLKELENLRNLCQQADYKKAELSRMVDNLEAKLNSGKCSNDLVKGMTTPIEGESKSIIEKYRELLTYDLTSMGQAMYDTNVPKIEEFQRVLQDVSNYGYQFGTGGAGSTISLYILEDLERWGPSIDYKGLFRSDQGYGVTDGSREESIDTLEVWASSITYHYKISEPYFIQFQDCHTNTIPNFQFRKFYSMLKEMYENRKAGSEGGEKEKSSRASITAIFKMAQKMLHGAIPDPEGALRYSGDYGDNVTEISELGYADSDWANEGAAKENLKGSLEDSDGFFALFENVASAAANKLLLVSYDSEMFSCYTTASGTENMATRPLSIDVNYYFQSELEYLYHGDLSSAVNNLNAVGGMILLVRFVLNYITSFTISSVNTMVQTIETTLTPFIGPFAIAVAETARLAVALAESALDVIRLRSGASVAIIKTDDTWKFSLTGLANMTADMVEAAAQELETEAKASGGGDDPLSDKGGMIYLDYLRLFLLFVDGNVLADRTKDLIELNMTNKKNGVGSLTDRAAREAKMAELPRFDLGNAVTDFSLETTVEVRMLFLSMPFAQQGIDGVVPPKTLPIRCRDDRGY